MARQTVNIGTSANKGNGDPLRTAFTKINANFVEVYAGTALDISNIGAELLPSTDGTLNLGSASKQWASIYAKNFLYLNGTRLSVSASGNLLVDNKAVVGGDIVGSVFADDSTLLVDAVNGNIPGYISLADLKTHVASSADFAAFKTTIAGL